MRIRLLILLFAFALLSACAETGGHRGYSGYDRYDRTGGWDDRHYDRDRDDYYEERRRRDREEYERERWERRRDERRRDKERNDENRDQHYDLTPKFPPTMPPPGRPRDDRRDDRRDEVRPSCPSGTTFNGKHCIQRESDRRPGGKGTINPCPKGMRLSNERCVRD